jgi:hypothetical protein
VWTVRKGYRLGGICTLDSNMRLKSLEWPMGVCVEAGMQVVYDGRLDLRETG